MLTGDSRSILLTGATGFVGRRLAPALVEGGARVHALTRSPPTQVGALMEGTGACSAVHRVDLTDGPAIARLLRRLRPWAVVHLAVARPGPATARRQVLAVNVGGAAHLARAAVESGVRCLVVAGSSLEYGHRDRPLVESDEARPTSFYGKSKAAATAIFRTAAASHRLQVVVLRPFYIYGPGEPDHRLIPTALRRARDGRPLALTGPGWRRDFVYVDDVVEAFVAALERALEPGVIVNVGTGRQTANEEVVAILDRLTGGGLEVIAGAHPPRDTDSRCWLADPTRARRLLGWTPRHDLEAGLRATVQASLAGRGAGRRMA